MGLVVPFALAPLDVYTVIFFVCIIICNLLYVCPIKLIKKKKKLLIFVFLTFQLKQAASNVESWRNVSTTKLTDNR